MGLPRKRPTAVDRMPGGWGNVLFRAARRALAPQKRTEINAIHEVDADAVLKRLGASDELAAGRIACAVCHLPVDEDSIGAVRDSRVGIVFACGRVECIRRL